MRPDWTKGQALAKDAVGRMATAKLVEWKGGWVLKGQKEGQCGWGRGTREGVDDKARGAQRGWGTWVLKIKALDFI